jgi:hypothetical protein
MNLPHASLAVTISLNFQSMEYEDGITNCMALTPRMASTRAHLSWMASNYSSDGSDGINYDGFDSLDGIK